MRQYFALLLILAFPAYSQSALPSAPVKRFSEEKFGHQIDDPYRWMEDSANEEQMKTWLTAAGDLTQARLKSLPEQFRFKSLLIQATQAGLGFSQVQSVGKRLFYLRMDPGARVPKLVIRDGKGPERVLLDPVARTTTTRAIANFAPSPDGDKVAILIGEGGGEVGQFQIFDTNTMTELYRLDGKAIGDSELSWLAPDRVSYTRIRKSASEGNDRMLNMQAMIVSLTSKGAVEQLGLGSELSGGPSFEAQEFPFIKGRSGESLAFGYGTGARADSRLLVSAASKVHSGKPDWIPVANYSDQVISWDAFGDCIYYISTKNSSSGELYRRRFSSGALDVAELVQPATDLILTNVLGTRDGVYLIGSNDGVSHLVFMSAGSKGYREVTLPFESNLLNPRVDADGRSIVFGLQGWVTGLRNYRATNGAIESLGLDSDNWEPLKSFTAQREEAISRDGTHVPLVIVRKKSAIKAPMPTLIEGYGSYGVLMTSPFNSPYYSAWVERGGAVVFCGTRGGGERGRVWHDAGRESEKLNAQEDFIACTRKIQELGVASAATTIATGTSASGLLVPVAVMKHPKLFTALLPRSAVLNATQLEASPNGPNQFAEMGDPRTQTGYEALILQDAYLAVAKAKDIPNVLVTIGLNDTRVAPWMGAKFVAAALKRFGNRRQILVRVDRDQGHGIGSARDSEIAEYSDLFAWAWDQAKAN